MHDKYGCSSSLSSGNNGKCSAMSVMLPCVLSISDSGFPLYLLFLVFTECNIVNSIHNLQGMKLLYVLCGCFSFGFGLFFSILIHFKTANFGKLLGVYSNNGEYIKMMAMKSACFLHTFFKLEKFGNKWKMGSGLSEMKWRKKLKSESISSFGLYSVTKETR